MTRPDLSLAPSLAATLIAAGPALAVHATPGLGARLEYDRAAVAAGEVWRLATCHLAHWTWDHLAWDVAACAVLAAVAVAIGARRLVAAVAVSAVAVPLAVAVMVPAMELYRGASGIAAALFAFVAVTLLRRAEGPGRGLARAVFVVALAAFGAKVGYEVVAHQALFVAPGPFVPVPWAHAAGGVAGAVVAAGARSV